MMAGKIKKGKVHSSARKKYVQHLRITNGKAATTPAPVHTCCLASLSNLKKS